MYRQRAQCMHERARTSSCTGASSLPFASASTSLLLAYARATIWPPYFTCICTYMYLAVHNGKCVVTSVRYQCACTKNENEKEWVSMRTRVRGNEKIAVYVYYPSAAAVDAALVPAEHDNPFGRTSSFARQAPT